METYKNVVIVVNESTRFLESGYEVNASHGSIAYKASFAGHVAFANSIPEVVALAKSKIDSLLR